MCFGGGCIGFTHYTPLYSSSAAATQQPTEGDGQTRGSSCLVRCCDATKRRGRRAHRASGCRARERVVPCLARRRPAAGRISIPRGLRTQPLA